MKKIITFAMLLFLVLSSYSQQQKQVVPDPRLYETLGESAVNDLKTNNPKQLLIENINMQYFCFVALKLPAPEGEYIMKGELKNYLKPDAGKSCNYSEIIGSESVNRYYFNLEQDAFLPTVYPLGNTGVYVVVNSKQWFDLQKRAVLHEYGF
ncbi:MAG: hypothetical protein MJZ72_01955 [Bacteroidales bacterium]|nr:hypothetical protein [Bacteroidales bacterium]